MKKFVGFYYRCSFSVCLWALLSLIGFMVLSSSAFALQSGDFTYTESGGTITITKYTGTGGAVVIPAAIDGMSVAGIGDLAFFNCTGLTSVTIPDSVTSIGTEAFAYCTGLTSVTIGNSVMSIGVAAFRNCTHLTSVTIPDSVTSIGIEAFAFCYGLTSIVVDASNTAYSSLDGVLYDNAMTELIECPSGKSGGFTIPASVTSIGVGAFNGCGYLTSVTIPDSVKSIESGAFAFCYGLTSVTIPDSVTSIGVDVFDYCTGLTSVTIPSSVTSIGGYPFYGCSSLTSIVVDASNPAYSSLDGVLYNKDMTVLINYPGGKYGEFTIPGSVTIIGDSAFVFCYGLTSVTIPNSVTSIVGGAFYGCPGLTSVTIPDSVTSIGYEAFNSCTGLTCAYFYGNAPSMEHDIFSGCASDFTVCYTAGSTGFTTPTWYGYPAAVCEETLITLSSFNATPKSNEVILIWSTASEINNAGFNLYRSETENGNYTKMNFALIPTKGSSTQGASYEFVDTNVQNRKTYYYKLEDIDLNGSSSMHGPVSATPRWILGIGK